MAKRKKKKTTGEGLSAQAPPETGLKEKGLTGDPEPERGPELEPDKQVEAQKPAGLATPAAQRPVQWITVQMSNGDRFKVPAKIVARRISELKQIPYEEVIRDAGRLVKFASENMTWSDVSLSAQKYELDIPVDYVKEWASAPKDVILEPEPRPEPPKKETRPDVVTAKEEDAGAGDFGSGADGEVVDLD